jgi:hypothetical protein
MIYLPMNSFDLVTQGLHRQVGVIPIKQFPFLLNQKSGVFFEPIQFHIQAAYLLKEILGLRFIPEFPSCGWPAIARPKHPLSSCQHFLPPPCYKGRMIPKFIRQ